jgi:hypothetical protein
MPNGHSLIKVLSHFAIPNTILGKSGGLKMKWCTPVFADYVNISGLRVHT